MHLPSSPYRTQCMIFLLQRGIENCQKFIAPNSSNSSLLIPDFLEHDFKIGIEQAHDLFGGHTLAQVGKTTNSDRDDTDFLCLSTKSQRLGILDKLLHDVRMYITPEDATYLLRFGLCSLQFSVIIHY